MKRLGEGVSISESPDPSGPSRDNVSLAIGIDRVQLVTKFRENGEMLTIPKQIYYQLTQEDILKVLRNILVTFPFGCEVKAFTKKYFCNFPFSLMAWVNCLFCGFPFCCRLSAVCDPVLLFLMFPSTFGASPSLHSLVAHAHFRYTFLITVHACCRGFST